MTPGPSIMRTAARSLVARDMISPVRRRWKYVERQALQVREQVVAQVELDAAREMPITELPHRSSGTGRPTTRDAEQDQRVAAELLGGDAAVEVVDREPQHLRLRERDRGW